MLTPDQAKWILDNNPWIKEKLDQEEKTKKYIDDLEVYKYRYERLKTELIEMKKQLDLAEGEGYPHPKTQVMNIHSHIFNTLLYYA